MVDYKNVFGVLAAVVGLSGYAPYLRDVFKKNTKPHAFSWLAWGVLEAVAFFAQIAKGAGIGALVTGVSALATLLVAAIAFTRRETEINFFDSVAFAGSVFGVVLWSLTRDPLIAVVLVVVADALAFFPTFRKSYYHPEQETLTEYGLSGAKWLIGLFALRSYNLTTWLYPVSLILTNWSFVVMSIFRRKIRESED